jgi:hypothetical protein
MSTRALPVALAPHHHAVATPVPAVEAKRLGDAAAGGEEEDDEGPVASLDQAVPTQCLGEDEALGLVEGLGQPLGEPGEVDDRPEVAGQPFLARGEAEQGPQGDQVPMAAARRENSPAPAGRRLRERW